MISREVFPKYNIRGAIAFEFIQVAVCSYTFHPIVISLNGDKDADQGDKVIARAVVEGDTMSL